MAAGHQVSLATRSTSVYGPPRFMSRHVANETPALSRVVSLFVFKFNIFCSRRWIDSPLPLPSYGAGSAFTFSACCVACASCVSGSSSPGLGSFLNSVKTG